MRNFVPVLLVMGLLSCLHAQDHIISVMEVTQSLIAIDSVELRTPSDSVLVPTPGFGDSAGSTDTFDLGERDWPSNGVKIYWTRNGRPLIPFLLAQVVQDSWYNFPQFDATLGSARIKFYLGQGGVEEGQGAPQSRLSVSPNPFSTLGSIGWTLPAAGNTRLEVFDATGQLVRTLVDGRLAAGRQSVSWNCLDNNGLRVGTGIYLARLTTDTGRTLAKLILTD